MTNQERIRAFTMRLNGATWQEISRAIKYNPVTIRDDLLRCVRYAPRQSSVIYPVIRDYIAVNYGGTVGAFATDCGISYNVMYSALTGRTRPSPAIRTAVAKMLGTSADNAFREEETS